MATGVDSDRRKMALAVAVPRIVDQRPGAIQRRWPEVIRVPADDVAGGIADGAADAFDADIGLPALRAFGVDIDETLLAFVARHEAALRLGPFIEEPGHVRRKVFDDRQVAQRRDLDAPCLRDRKSTRLNSSH